MEVSTNHYSNGYENYGPNNFAGSTTEHTFTPKASVTFQQNDNNLYYATYAKGFRPGGYNAPLPPYCGPDLAAEGFPSGQAPQTYNSDTTQSYEIGAKNNFNNRFRVASSVYYIKWDNIQQNVYVGGACGLQFTDNLGTAVAKGFDMQAEAVIGGGLSVEFSAGYTSARFTKNSINNLAVNGDAISGQSAINYSPGTNAPWNLALSPQYDFRIMDLEAFVRMDWTYEARNTWTAPVQDPRSAQYDPNSYTLPAQTFGSMRAGIKAGNFEYSLFCENLLNSYTINNYALVQETMNVLPQQNDFTFRPRTFGVTVNFKM